MNNERHCNGLQIIIAKGFDELKQVIKPVDMHPQILYTFYGIFDILSYFNFTTAGGLFRVRFLLLHKKGAVSP